MWIDRTLRIKKEYSGNQANNLYADTSFIIQKLVLPKRASKNISCCKFFYFCSCTILGS